MNRHTNTHTHFATCPSIFNLRSLLRSYNDIGPSGGAAVAAMLPRLTALQLLRLEYLPPT